MSFFHVQVGQEVTAVLESSLIFFYVAHCHTISHDYSSLLIKKLFISTYYLQDADV